MSTKFVTISTPPFANILLLSYCLYSDEAPKGNRVRSSFTLQKPDAHTRVEVLIPDESSLTWKFKVICGHPGLSLHAPLCEKEITFNCNSENQSIVIDASDLPDIVFHRYVQVHN